MANREHLDMLKQGVDAWNTWRKEHPEIEPDLTGAHLSGADLSGANLSGANLSGANLSNVELREANLSRCYIRTDFWEGIEILSFAYTNLSRANFQNASLRAANLSEADLREADLQGADLLEANLREADLQGADLGYSLIGKTIFADNDLCDVKGLDTVLHYGASYISTSTLERSKGNILKAFLQGAGLTDSLIEYAHLLAKHSIEYYTCFISYSSKDSNFAERLYADLQQKEIRCWFAPEDLKIGDKIRPRIDRSIHLHDKLLIILSQHSIASTWVEKEVETAFDREARENKLVLFPIRLDDAVKQCEQAWARDIRRMRHIGDFSRWKEHDEYQKAFTRLLRDLKANPPPKPHP